MTYCTIVATRLDLGAKAERGKVKVVNLEDGHFQVYTLVEKRKQFEWRAKAVVPSSQEAKELV